MPSEQRPRLSLLVHTLDEEERLPLCLASAAALADQIVVVDMESGDRTREVAAGFGAEVYSHPRVAVVEFARDYGVSLCRGDWVLVLDADERLSPGLAEWIERFLDGPEADGVRAVAFPRRNWFFGDWLDGGSWWPGYVVRLFRRGEAAYGRSIHAQPVVGDGIRRVEPRLELALEHLAYPRIDDFVERTLRRYSEVETELGRHRPAHPLALCLLVVRRLVVELLWKRGYRDGTRGFIVASLLAMYEFLNRAKAWERENGLRVPPELR